MEGVDSTTLEGLEPYQHYNVAVRIICTDEENKVGSLSEIIKFRTSPGGTYVTRVCVCVHVCVFDVWIVCVCVCFPQQFFLIRMKIESSKWLYIHRLLEYVCVCVCVCVCVWEDDWVMVCVVRSKAGGSCFRHNKATCSSYTQVWRNYTNTNIIFYLLEKIHFFRGNRNSIYSWCGVSYSGYGLCMCGSELVLCFHAIQVHVEERLDFSQNAPLPIAYMIMLFGCQIIEFVFVRWQAVTRSSESK